MEYQENKNIKPYYSKNGIIIYNDDCFNIISQLELKSIDAVISDPPYQLTSCEWDKMPDIDKLWEVLKPIGKENTAYIFTASQPFTSKLVMSNLKWFKYEWIWEKTRPTGFFTAKKMPMKIHENILVFYKKQPTYNPIKTKADDSKIDKRKTLNGTYSPYLKVFKERVKDDGMRYPITVQKINSISKKGQHPTQKPEGLLEYLIKTYTHENDVILDPFMGSGTTLVVAKNLGRKSIGIEISKEYCDMAIERLNKN